VERAKRTQGKAKRIIKKKNFFIHFKNVTKQFKQIKFNFFIKECLPINFPKFKLRLPKIDCKKKSEEMFNHFISSLIFTLDLVCIAI